VLRCVAVCCSVLQCVAVCCFNSFRCDRTHSDASGLVALCVETYSCGGGRNAFVCVA